jgi:hypothetical protein
LSFARVTSTQLYQELLSQGIWQYLEKHYSKQHLFLHSTHCLYLVILFSSIFYSSGYPMHPSPASPSRNRSKALAFVDSEALKGYTIDESGVSDQEERNHPINEDSTTNHARYGHQGISLGTNAYPEKEERARKRSLSNRVPVFPSFHLHFIGCNLAAICRLRSLRLVGLYFEERQPHGQTHKDLSPFPHALRLSESQEKRNFFTRGCACFITPA